MRVHSSGARLLSTVAHLTQESLPCIAVVAYYAPAVVEGLTNGLLYHCLVETLNCMGTSAPSAAVYATPSMTAQLPSAAEILNIAPYINTAGSIWISWQQPWDDGGVPLQSYSVACYTRGASTPAGEVSCQLMARVGANA